MSLENKTILKGFLPFFKINEADDILSSSSMIVYVNMGRKSNFVPQPLAASTVANVPRS